ncbi:MAG: hypothetical protein ACK5WF_12865 [Cyclobacteriaceae bacterium]
MKLNLILFLTLVLSVDVIACKCLPMTWEEEVVASERIFHGKVLAVNDNQFDIEVMEIWKGEFASGVFQFKQGATSCTSRMFTIGEEYIFYLRSNEVPNCSRTTEFQLTINLEALDAKFKGIGNRKAIEADELTVIQRDVLKNHFKKSGNEWLADLDRITPRFAVEGQWVAKHIFFESIRHTSESFHWKNIKIEKDEYFIFWLGRDWKKAERRLKKKATR